ncbi:hypothetical protein ACN27G_13750 [Plantactinospora sp. WMMB334]|uniref:hypothetical protein n=1 Tax=Plantactinospora sp. WMMB334 TaxID=3404119 RepID=UPI003B9363F0
MSEDEYGHDDVEGLARKLRDLESQLTAAERRLLKRIVAAAMLSGVVVGAATPAGGVAHGADLAGADASATQATAELDGIRAQFAAAFTPGKEWTTTMSDIGLVV